MKVNMVEEDDKKSKVEKLKALRSASKPEITDLIGRRLRQFYEETAKQPVPDRFLDLLKQLEIAESHSTSESQSEAPAKKA